MFCASQHADIRWCMHPFTIPTHQLLERDAELGAIQPPRVVGVEHLREKLKRILDKKVYI